MMATLNTPYAGGFNGSEHRFALRVYFEDTDFTGVVYHANYLRYLERARSDMLRAAGIDQRASHEAGGGVYAVSALSIRYRAPARLDDALVVVSKVAEVRAAACIVHQRVMRGPDMLAEAEVTAVFLSAEGRPRRQPAQWIAAFEALKGEETT